MGYNNGIVLQRQNEGIIDSLAGDFSKPDLGFILPVLETCDEKWDFSLERIVVKEELKWIFDSVNSQCLDSYERLLEWIVRDKPKICVDNENVFCDPLLLKKILEAKEIFNELDVNELSKARCRANPFESIRSAFFMNRAALKIANIDAVTNFIFTDIDRNPYHSKTNGPYYFADVCAGPGGFTEYMLWRKKWAFKGFGFTLKADHDFELNDSQCISSLTFSAHYGAYGDGDICNPENINHFSKHVLHETEACGVHFMMSDGGFSVEGMENLQEVLSKKLYICQCLTALKIVRTNGHFVTKLFDLFTEFSVGLVFLMYKCFEKVAIFKPNTSRPANAERYLICYGKKESNKISAIIKYLIRITEELWDLHQTQNRTVDINEIVPLSIITAHEEFYRYIVESNNSIGSRQVLGLYKLAVFCRNPSLVDPRQEELRKKCLQFWRIPDKPRKPLPILSVKNLLSTSLRDQGFMFAQPKFAQDLTHLQRILKDTRDWYYTTLSCTNERNACSFYAGVSGSRVFRLLRSKWIPVKRLHLVCGTLLYGEMVKEYQVSDSIETCKQSLHVIDALRLGDISLNDMSFTERSSLIETYCKAVNHESKVNYLRIRPKYFTSLYDTNMLQLFLTNEENDVLRYSSLPPLGFNSITEYYEINSVLLLKAHWDYQFIATFCKRIQIYFNPKDKFEDNGTFFNRKIIPQSLIEFLKSEY